MISFVTVKKVEFANPLITEAAGAFLNGVLTTPAPRYSAPWPAMTPLLKRWSRLSTRLLRQGCEVMERYTPLKSARRIRERGGEILISELQARSTEIWRYAMKGSAAIFLSAGLLFLMLAGCRTAAKEIQMKSHSKKTDVFREVKAGETVPKGFVDMTIRASIKTHAEGQYPLEPKEQFHGNLDYPFLINIDGQAAIWKVSGSTDDTPLYDEGGNRRTDPEAGKGVKYILDKKIRIAAGPHRIFFGLAAESVTKKIEVTLKDGEIYVLQLKPVYEYTIHPYRIPSFLEGVKDYEVFLNGAPVQ